VRPPLRGDLLRPRDTMRSLRFFMAGHVAPGRCPDDGRGGGGRGWMGA
jgi:hypothetical protein